MNQDISVLAISPKYKYIMNENNHPAVSPTHNDLTFFQLTQEKDVNCAQDKLNGRREQSWCVPVQEISPRKHRNKQGAAATQDPSTKPTGQQVVD